MSIATTLTDRTVIVTGGAGLIGSSLCDELVAAGARVIVIDDFSRGLQENIAHHRERIEIREGDLENAVLPKPRLATPKSCVIWRAALTALAMARAAISKFFSTTSA